MRYNTEIKSAKTESNAKAKCRHRSRMATRGTSWWRYGDGEEDKRCDEQLAN